MSEHSKQPSNSGVGGSSITPDVKSSVLMAVTNSASSRSPKASGKLLAVQHDQPLNAQSSTGPTLLVTSRDSPIPAHLVNVGNTADDPMEIHNSSSKSTSSDNDHQVSNDRSSSGSNSDSESGSGFESDSHSTTSRSGSYTDSSVSAIITDDGSHSSDGSGSPIGSPISKCIRHKSSGHCHPHSRSCSHSPPAASQAITVTDDEHRTPSLKHHHKSHNHQRHKKHQHNSPSHSPPSGKLHSSHSFKRKQSSKATTSTDEGPPSSHPPVTVQGTAISSTSSTVPAKTHKTSGGLQFAPSGSFQSIPMTDRIKRQKGARYIRVYCHQNNLYVSALGISVGASLGEDELDLVPSGGYPHPSYKCSSRGAIYLDKSNPD